MRGLDIIFPSQIGNRPRQLQACRRDVLIGSRGQLKLAHCSLDPFRESSKITARSARTFSLRNANKNNSGESLGRVTSSAQRIISAHIRVDMLQGSKFGGGGSIKNQPVKIKDEGL